MRLTDTHFRYDFLPPVSCECSRAGIAQEGVEIIAQTIRPSGFVGLERENLPMVAVGYRPWHIDDNCERELEIFREALPRIRLVGEIGSGFASRRLNDVPAETQIYVFTSILDTVQASSLSHILSVHTVHGADTVLDLLEQDLISNSGSTFSKNPVPIFHRFGGTGNELTRLIWAGGYISVNPLMLWTKRGWAYVSQMPVDRLLLEAGLPRDPGSGDAVGVVSTTLVTVLRDTVVEVATLRSVDEAELKNVLAENAEALGI